MKYTLQSLLLLLLAALSSYATAGNIFFGLERSATELTVINQGDSSAYYPEALRLLPDGRWEALTPIASESQPAELSAGGKMRLGWSVPTGEGPIVAALPVMLRFFDQAGAGMGQITMFDQPAPTAHPLEVAYVKQRLRIEPPQANQGIHSTWLLWGQEEGITPLLSQPRFEHAQPPAQHITWDAKSPSQFFDLGKGLPNAALLHETERGFEFQSVGAGKVRGREQRAFWLGQGSFFLTASAITAIAALLIAIFGLYATRKRKHA